jgi:hypothetical protein
MNFIPASVETDGLRCPLLAAPLAKPVGLPNGEIRIGIRPEFVRMHADPLSDSVPAVLIDQAIGVAGRYLTKAKIGDTTVKVNTRGRPPAPLGGTVHLSVVRERIALFVDGMRVAS